MAVLRSAQGPLERENLFKRSRLAAGRFDAALESLVGDGLASSTAHGYRLPEG